jgi:hypothetical protein
MNCRGPAGTFVDKNCPDAEETYGRCREMPRWVLTRRDGLLACEKSEGNTPLVTPIDQVPVNGRVWPGAENVEDDGVDSGLQVARVTELELGKFTEVCRVYASVKKTNKDYKLLKYT